MRLIRSHCPRLAPARNWVKDDAERIENDNWDYKELLSFNDSIIHLDWDTAVSRESLVAFIAEVKKNPESVLVAPQLLYRHEQDGTFIEGVWNCGIYDPSAVTYSGYRRVERGDEWCDEFGFGMVYLPRHMIEEYIIANPTVEFRDTSFCPWHMKTYGQARIFWPAETVHLHYRISDVPL